MADPHGIRVGDTLRVEMEVIDIIEGQKLGENGARVRAPGGTEHFVGFGTIRKAEHIPAPKVFKRGDWVRRGMWRGGVVYGILDNPRPLYQVSWPDSTVSGEYGQDLEHDEAPE